MGKNQIAEKLIQYLEDDKDFMWNCDELSRNLAYELIERFFDELEEMGED